MLKNNQKYKNIRNITQLLSFIKNYGNHKNSGNICRYLPEKILRMEKIQFFSKISLTDFRNGVY